VFLKFFIGNKGIYNLVSFILTPHGRDGFQKGYMQWGPLPADSDSGKYLKHYDFLYSGDALEYYSYGDERKTGSREEWLSSYPIIEAPDKRQLRPYLLPILNFFHPEDNEACEPKISQNKTPNPILTSPPRNVVGVFSPLKPFETVLSSTQTDDTNSSKRFYEHKEELLRILSFELSQLPYLPLFPKDAKRTCFIPNVKSTKKKRSIKRTNKMQNEEYINIKLSAVVTNHFNRRTSFV
jgi:hypothetical protein